LSVRPLRLPLTLSRPAREERGRVVAGVCSGLGEALGVDPTLVRLALTLLAFASGAGILAYLGAWSWLPAPGQPAPRRRRRIAGAVLFVWAAILALSGLGLPDSLVWPLALAGAGAVLASGRVALGLSRGKARLAAAVLVVAGVTVFVGENTHGTATTLLSPGAIGAALILVLGPWAWQLARERDAERSARIRTQERADLAARVHDSVLQTLALIQREPDPRRVATLARRQERELRAWLYPDRSPAAEGTLAQAVESAAAEIEELHGVRVEVVRTGDTALDEPARALVLAAREAMANAARHSGADEISVFVDASPDRIGLYVRDRGVGFDPDAVAEGRHGISESIRARMERAGGTATIVSAPGEGTDVELELPRGAS
jgi:signal transduction histidine kinase